MEEEVEEKTSEYLYLLYRNGKGEDKTLSQLGLLRKIKDAVKNNQEITKKKGDGYIQDRFINQMKAGEEGNDSLQGEIRNDDMEFESRNQIDSQTAADENDYHCDIYSWNAALNSGHDPRGQNGEAWDGNNETVAQIYERYPDNRNNGIPPANTRGYAFYDSPNDNDNVPEHMEFYDNTNSEAGGYTLYRTDGIEIPEPQQRDGMDNNRVFIPLDNLPEGDD